jgi:peptide/nickel transport system substrate-binding protein
MLRYGTRTIAAVAALIGVAALSQGVGATTTPPDSTPADGSAAPETSAAPAVDFEVDPDASVVVGFAVEPTNLDIIHQSGAQTEQLLLGNVYETLLTATNTGEIGPGLASAWETSEDGLTVTLTLQDGVSFHDGSPLTAADAAWSLTETQAAGNAAAALANVASIEAPDDATVVLTLSQPDSFLPWSLSRRAGVVLKVDSTDLENTANGTGPFTLTDWSQGDSVTLSRFDGYWGEPAGAAEVVFQYITDPTAAVQALLDGDLDILTRLNTDLLGQFEGNDDFVISTGTTNGEYTLGINNADEALSNPLVRQAITQAIDKEGILELFAGYGTIVGGPVPPTDPWYEDLNGLYPYDPDAARAKLEEAGYGDGLSLTFVVPNQYPQAHADYIVASLGDIGIDVELQSVDFNAWLDQVYTNHDYDLTLVLHVEPRDLGNYARDDYYWNYVNPEVAELYSAAQAATDPAEATDLLRQAAHIVAVEAPAVWLLVWDDVLAARTGVAGYPTFDVLNRFDAAGIVSDGE